MGIGKPVLVTEAEENSPFPPDASIRIPPGPCERTFVARPHDSVTIGK